MSGGTSSPRVNVTCSFHSVKVGTAGDDWPNDQTLMYLVLLRDD